jgi:hypothetical protein
MSERVKSRKSDRKNRKNKGKIRVKMVTSIKKVSLKCLY